MRRAVSIVAIAAVITAVLAVPGCGQKGPLYLRDNPPPGVKPPKPAPYEPVPYPSGAREDPDAPSR
ncbi:MAG TPA: lipoprotein [Burkholderiales bacterium]|nr:lipoprotein [Burkholderiales bacterium]